jgi:hypothetical protein
LATTGSAGTTHRLAGQEDLLTGLEGHEHLVGELFGKGGLGDIIGMDGAAVIAFVGGLDSVLLDIR